MPVDRNWTVPEDHMEISFDPEGNLLLTARVVSDQDEDALAQAIFEAIAILRRVGGTIQIASQRGEVAREVVVTESYIFAYNSYSPLVRKLGEDRHQAQSAAMDEAADHLSDGLTADELEQHFPPSMDDGEIGDAIAAAQAEVPAEAEPAAAAAVE